jgi:hypothetical protein
MMESHPKTKADKIEHIKKLTKVSSATLAANNTTSLMKIFAPWSMPRASS